MKRINGSGSIFINLPLPTGACHLILGSQGNSVSGLALIDGKEAHENDSATATTLFKPETKRHRIHITVRPIEDNISIAARCDGKLLISWTGKADRLSTSESWGLDRAKCFGIGADMSSVAFSRMRVRIITGELKPVK